MALIGAHISVAGGLYRAYERADKLGCESMQIFTRNQRQWHSKALSIQEIEDFYRASVKSGIKVVVSHASYLINLAGNERTRSAGEEVLLNEVRRCHLLAISDVVLHPGFAGEENTETALCRIAESLLRVIAATDDTRVNILLETMAGQGSVIGGELRHLSRILELADYNKRIGVCADMCHVFAAGYELRGPEGYLRFTAALDNNIGLERVRCWHLSDSKNPKGEKMDRHTHIGAGEIGLLPFGCLMTDVRFKNVPTILETPKNGRGDAGNLTILRKLRGG